MTISCLRIVTQVYVKKKDKYTSVWYLLFVNDYRRNTNQKHLSLGTAL